MVREGLPRTVNAFLGLPRSAPRSHPIRFEIQGADGTDGASLKLHSLLEYRCQRPVSYRRSPIKAVATPSAWLYESETFLESLKVLGVSARVRIWGTTWLGS